MAKSHHLLGTVSIYGFCDDVLNAWGQSPPSSLKDLERLEQLRLIKAGYIIAIFPVAGTPLSVDTAEQLVKGRVMV